MVQYLLTFMARWRRPSWGVKSSATRVISRNSHTSFGNMALSMKTLISSSNSKASSGLSYVALFAALSRGSLTRAFQGNIGATVGGLPFLEEEGIIPNILDIAETSQVLSVRGLVHLLAQTCLLLKPPSLHAVLPSSSSA